MSLYVVRRTPMQMMCWCLTTRNVFGEVYSRAMRSGAWHADAHQICGGHAPIGCADDLSPPQTNPALEPSGALTLLLFHRWLTPL